MAKDSKISITPLTRDFERGGGGGAIITSGSGTWTAAASEPWITLNETSGTVGTPVAYKVTASTNVGQRVGYVYVSGYTHTVTQNGYEATVDPTNVEYERDGGKGTISIGLSGKWAWNARPNVDWLSVTPTHGVGSGSVTYQVAPYYEVATRSGTLTVGDKTVTVFQYGSRMKLSKNTATCNYETHIVPVTVDALAMTEWSATPNASWLSIVDSDNGQNRRGGGALSIAVAENPSYKVRTGTVTIGTETLTITQEGRTALDFSVSPATATAAVSGGNGLLAVLATPDLPWTVKSEANWLTIMNGFTSGAGNGNVVYVASPNSTLSQRTGKITVTPPSGSGLAVKTLTVTQPAATSAISPSGYEFEAAGESVSVEVTVADIVEWSISESLDWITVSGSTSRVGPGTVTIAASANNTVYPRSGTVTIAGKKFSVSQKARGVRLDYDNIIFKTDGGYESFTVHPDGNVAWTAVASDSSWITVFGATSGTGEAEVEYIISPYVGDGTPRTGWIQVGDQKVYITQRSYDLDITPRAATVTGNNGAGEIGVSAGIGDIWNAIVTEPWVTIVTGYDSGTGNGTVRYTYTENNTGKTRTAKVIIAGEVYTLTQAARIMVNIDADVVGHGSVEYAGSYVLGSEVALAAVPDDGYEFLYWTGDCGETMQNPVKVTANVAKKVTAHFGPLTPEFVSCESGTNGVKLAWRNLAWAISYKIYRAPANAMPEDVLVTVPAVDGGTYLDTTAEGGTIYWYWVEAVGVSDTSESKNAVSGFKRRTFPITYSNLQGATHSNPDIYAEGVAFAFLAPSVRAGYTFTGWTPAAITEDMIGAVSVAADWSVNNYTVAFNANGGTGTMADEPMTYDVEKTLTANAFTRKGYTFAGWSTSAGGAVKYANGATVKNLAASGTVTLYAKWTPNSYVVDFNPGQGGTGAMPDQPMTYDEAEALYANLFARTGYTFLGWTDDPDEVEEVLYYDGVVVENLTDEDGGEYDLYAIWAANEYKVRFNANGGMGTMADQMFLYDEELALVANKFVRTGFTFTGWAKTAGGTVVYAGDAAVSNLTAELDGVVTLYAKWAANPYSVVFDANGGEGFMDPVDCTYEKVQMLPANAFTRSGYTFVGWATSAGGAVAYADKASVSTLAASGTVTLYAKWTPISYSIKFNANGGGGTMANESMTYDVEKALTANAFTRTGYMFAGWATSVGGAVVYANGESLKNLTMTQGAVINLYAKWTVNGYTVKFNANGGSGTMADEAMTYDVENTLTACAFTRTGYTFAGWATSAGGAVKHADGATVKNLAASGTVTLYAKWTPITYTVKFKANGGGGTMANEAMTYDSAKALTACAFMRTGYTFVGWATSAGGTVVYVNGQSVKNLTATQGAVVDLYAKWTANPYTVKFDANGGNGTMADESFTYDAAGQVLASNAFVRKGYMFLGWATSVDGDVVYANGAKVNNLAASGAITLYAQWAPVSVKVYGFRQRFPWNNLVDVDCEVFGESGAAYQLNIQAMDAASGNMLTVTDVRLDGGVTTGNPVSVPNGRSRVIWNAATDLPDGFRSERIKLRASLVFGDDAE